jgi:hypothetical protein
MRAKAIVSGLVGVAAVLACGTGALAATTIKGILFFEPDPVGNAYDGSQFSTPPGVGNVAGPTVTVGPGVEFGYEDPANTDTADFTETSLKIEDVTDASQGGAAPWQQIFTANTPGFFSNIVEGTDSFPNGVTFQVTDNKVTDDTLTLNWGGSLASATQDVSFTFGSAAPEPASWALIMLGVGAIGAGLRFSKRGQLGAQKTAA